MSAFRTLRVTPNGIVRLLQAITDGDVTLCSHGIPSGAAIAGVRFNDTDRILELDLVNTPNWPDGDDGPEIGFQYACRYGTGWGQPIAMGPPPNA